MRALVGVLTVFLLASATAFAESQVEKLAHTTPEERARIQTATMKQKLALTDQQLPAVAKINLAIATRMQPVLEGSDGLLAKMRKAKAIEAERDAELQKLLPPQQYQKWLAEKESIKQEAEAKLAAGGAGGTH